MTNKQELTEITPDSLDDEALADLIGIRRRGVEHHASEGNKVQHAIQSLTLIALCELQELRRNYLALRCEIEDVQSQLYEAENQANEYARELQERRKADSAVSSFPGLFNSARALLDVLYEFGPDEVAISEYVTNLEDALRDATAPPAPLIPDEKPMPEASKMYAIDAVAAIAEVRGWNACRAAMLQAGNSPATPDGWIPVSERMPEGMQTVITSNGFDIGQGWWDGEAWKSFDCHDVVPGKVTHWMPLPASPHFREIGNSSTNNFRENAETSTKCWCHTCRPVTMSDMRFVVFPDCGNKRCPRANDHRNACTGSNEPGQIGSAYQAAPQQEGKRNDAQP